MGELLQPVGRHSESGSHPDQAGVEVGRAGAE
jgi:hypothetical protein